jgi:hypothetical protein
MYTPEEYHKQKEERKLLKLKSKEPKYKYEYHLPEKRMNIFTDIKNIEVIKNKYDVNLVKRIL